MWLSLGKVLSLDNNLLDKIFANNDRDEDCLQEMLQLYLARPDLNHSWEEIQEALKNIGEGSMTNQPELHISPVEDSAIAVQSEISLMGDSLLNLKEVSPCK